MALNYSASRRPTASAELDAYLRAELTYWLTSHPSVTFAELRQRLADDILVASFRRVAFELRDAGLIEQSWVGKKCRWRYCVDVTRQDARELAKHCREAVERAESGVAA